MRAIETVVQVGESSSYFGIRLGDYVDSAF